MPNQPWKSSERVVARYFGTERNPYSGKASGQTRSDSLHPILFIESKSHRRLPKGTSGIRRIYDEAETKRNSFPKDHGKFIVVVAKEKGKPLPVEDYPAWIRCPDGILEGRLVRVTLRDVKELLDAGRIPQPARWT